MFFQTPRRLTQLLEGHVSHDSENPKLRVKCSSKVRISKVRLKGMIRMGSKNYAVLITKSGRLLTSIILVKPFLSTSSISVPYC